MDEDAVVERLKRQIAGYDEQRMPGIKQEISRLRRRVHELEDVTARLYEDKYSGQISGDTFTVLVQKSEQERIQKTERLEAFLAEVKKWKKKPLPFTTGPQLSENI